MHRGHLPSVKSGYVTSELALRALQAGDTQALIDSHRDRFAGWKMEKEDDDSDDDDDDDDDGDSGADDDKDDKDADDDDDSSGDDDDKVTKADLERMERRMKAADKRAADAEAKLRKIDDGKKDDLTRATDRVSELEGENKEQKETINSLRLQVAFLSTNKHTWHKPGAALKLAQSEGYFEDLLDDDGVIDEKAMGKALDKLAKDHEYLVKRATSGPSGESAGGRSNNGKDDKQVQEQDRRRAPALSRRR